MTGPDPAHAGSELRVVATPIGNLGDLSARVADALASADLVVAEDTRRARLLLSHLGVASPPLLALPAPRETERIAQVLRRLERGERVTLVTDAGTPAVSDPGSRLTRAALDAGFTVRVVPGPSAVTAALAVAGADGRGFLFVGFLPPRGRDRRRELEEIVASTRAVVLFESPRRTLATLAELADLVPDRRLVLCRELTKVHEQVLAGTPDEVRRALAEGGARGEVTLVLDPAPRSETEGEVLPVSDLEERLRQLLDAGARPSAAARDLARATGRPRSELYALALSLRADAPPADGE